MAQDHRKSLADLPLRFTLLPLLSSLSVAAPSNAQSAACPSDLTGDGIVAGDDLATVLGGWSPGGCKACAGDINGDHRVTGADLAQLLNAWGPAPGLPGLDLNPDGVINGADLAILLNAWGVCAE